MVPMRTTTPQTSHRQSCRRGARGLSAAVIAATTLVALTSCSSDSKSSATTEKSTVTTDAPDTTVAETDAPATTEAPATTTAETTAETTETTTDETTGETTEETTDATTESTTEETTGDTTDDVEAILQELLLTPEEVGPTFVEDTYEGGDGTTPCGINVDGQFPSIAKVGTQIDNADPAVALQEEIHVYNTDDEAQGAFNLASTGFACGTVEGITFGDLTDVSDDLGLPSYGITVTSEGVEGVIFLALESDAVIVLQFQQEAGADVSSLPDPTTVTKAAIDKIETLLNG